MKLKEQFENVEIMFENQIGTLKYDELSEASNQCVTIAESFAINFANWYDFTLKESDNLNDRFTPKELIEMFKKEKGL
jgi:hypothetical protein